MLKKFISIILICVLLSAVAACGKKSDDIPVSATVGAESVKTNEQVAVQEEIEATTLPTLSGNFELPEGESVESWGASDVSCEDVVPAEDQHDATTPIEEIKNEGCGCVYADYLAMSAAAQEDYMNTFASPMDFIAWCKTAEAEHATHVTIIEASGGDLDISDYIN